MMSAGRIFRQHSPWQVDHAPFQDGPGLFGQLLLGVVNVTTDGHEDFPFIRIQGVDFFLAALKL